MAPDHESTAADDRAVENGQAIEPGELYVIIRKAVEDAILGVIGTLLLLGIALVLVWSGIMIAASAWNTNVFGALGGIFLMLVGFYVAASSLGVVPSVSDLV